MNKKPRDIYRVENRCSLSEGIVRVLSELYLPLIGKDAYMLYMVLVNEGSSARIQENHQRLLLLTDLDIRSLEKAFVRLEEYMLVRTYVKEGDNRNSYIYFVNEPLNEEDFLDNHIYMSRYMQVMGKKETEDTISRFKAGAVSVQGYRDITTPLTNTRNESYSSPAITYTKVKPQYQFSENDADIHFDYEHFIATTSTLVFPGELRTRRNMNLIGRLATVYGLSADRMRILVSRCVDIDTVEFDEEKLKILAERSTSDVKKSTDPYALSPVSFLQSKQNGAQVSRTDKRILEHLALDMNFSNEVINVMMEYILKVSANRINEKFVDMVAGEWARNGIHTKEQALMQVKKDMQTSGRKGRPVTIDMPAYMDQKQTDKKPASQEQIAAFRRLQNQIKE